jgi:hypothetical protein
MCRGRRALHPQAGTPLTPKVFSWQYLMAQRLPGIRVLINWEGLLVALGEEVRGITCLHAMGRIGQWENVQGYSQISRSCIEEWI